MTALALPSQGKLEETIESLQLDIKRRPSDIQLRMALFEMLAVSGRWERAFMQLNMAVILDRQLARYAEGIRNLAELERQRSEVFRGNLAPSFIDHRPSWLSSVSTRLVSSVTPDVLAEYEAAYIAAMAAAPARSGRIDGRMFDWIADADSRLGPVMELYLKDNYYWLPMERLKSLRVIPACDVIDLLWLRVECTLMSGTTLSGFMPARYPGSELAAADDLILGKSVAWTLVGGTMQLGTGIRVLSTEREDTPVTQIREIVFN